VRGGGAVAAGHPETVRIAAAALADGGNAVDACVAAGIASWVAEPTVAGPGGGGFMLVHDARRGGTAAYDFFTAVPGLGSDGPRAPLVELDVEFGTATQRFLVGPGSNAVPGVGVGLHEVHRRRGRLPFARLVEPAAVLARTGAALNAGGAYLHRILDPLFRDQPEAAAIYRPHGRALVEGERVPNTPLAETLERYARHGAAEFATGETARAISAAQAAAGGGITAQDLARYRVITRRPVEVAYHGARVLTNPPPSAGGVLIAHALARLERAGTAGDPLGAPALAALARALRAAAARRDAAFERALYRGGARRLVLGAAALALPDAPVAEPPVARGTSHVSVIDADGNAASMTCSTGSGSGWVAGGTGVHLNNMLGETDLMLASWPPRAGERITSMMAPTIVLGRDDRVRLVVGSSGSARIRSAVTAVLTRALAGMPLRDAVESPRIHPEAGALDCEGGLAEEVLGALEAAGERVVRWPGLNLYFGGAQAAARAADGGLDAAGDPRRGGAAALT
jgi:gamma-glutamyltranspeptidase / glutathione hydrolase